MENNPLKSLTDKVKSSGNGQKERKQAKKVFRIFSHPRGREFESLQVHQMDIGRTPIISKAASPSWCGSDVETNSEGQGIKALASAVFIGLFRFALGILPFRKLPLALFAVIVFPYLRDEKTGKSFYNSLRQFDLTGFSSDFRLFFRQRHFPFPRRRTRPAGRRKQGKGKLFPQPGLVISSRREWRG